MAPGPTGREPWEPSPASAPRTRRSIWQPQRWKEPGPRDFQTRQPLCRHLALPRSAKEVIPPNARGGSRGESQAAGWRPSARSEESDSRTTSPSGSRATPAAQHAGSVRRPGPSTADRSKLTRSRVGARGSSQTSSLPMCASFSERCASGTKHVCDQEAPRRALHDVRDGARGWAIRSNPVSGVRIPAPAGSDEPDEDKAKAMTRAELALFLAAAPESWRLFFEFLAHTGLRISEALGLRWAHLDLGERPRVMVREQLYKGNRRKLKSRDGRRDVPLSPQMARSAPGATPGRLPRRGRARVRLSQRHTVARLESAPASAEARPVAVSGCEWVTFHTFRHTCASLLFEAGPEHQTGTGLAWPRRPGVHPADLRAPDGRGDWRRRVHGPRGGQRAGNATPGNRGKSDGARSGGNGCLTHENGKPGEQPERAGQDHNPRVGGSSPSSGTYESPAAKGFLMCVGARKGPGWQQSGNGGRLSRSADVRFLNPGPAP